MTSRDILLGEALRSVAAESKRLERGGPLQSAFYQWVMYEENASCAALEALSRELCEDVAGSGRSIQSVAALGYLVPLPEISKDEKVRRIFAQGLDWLTGRSATSQAALAALLQPVAQLGLLCGVIEGGDDALFARYARWFAGLTERKGAETFDTGWRRDLLGSVGARLKGGLKGKEKLKVGPSALIMAARGIAEIVWDTLAPFEAQLVARLKRLNYSDAEEAVLDLAAYRYMVRQDVRVNVRIPALDDVALVLAELQAALRRWTWEEEKRTATSGAQKWRIEHEYHFQNLVYVVLAPIFRDLHDEEWLASVGQKKPRADLVIPSLALLVEVKFWREKQKPQDLISQIAEDASLYLKKGSPYRHVLPVIWDDGRRTEEYRYLSDGLKELRDVLAPVIVARPAFMT